MCAVILACAACDEGGGDEYPDADADEDVFVDVGEGGCWREMEVAEPERQSALYREYGEEGEHHFWIYQGVIEGSTVWPPATFVQIEVWPERGGPAEPGTYEIEEGPYASCGLCLLVREGCVPGDGLARCDRDYIAVSGTVQIDEMGVVGEMFTGSLSTATLVETAIDWDSGAFGDVTVEGGRTWCLGEMDLEIGISLYPER
ncbi:MAG: hypothetical protein JRG91_01320 [Deltaproteobacteria bacterium]|nr:hypothetical protein [Deltaproteobacteria bacterium]